MVIARYENIPCMARFLPSELRQPVSLIYAFVQRARDLADDVSVEAMQRLSLLNGFRTELEQISSGNTPDLPLFRDLAAMTTQYSVPLEPFFDLLDAFSQDVVKIRYTDFTEVMQYCRCSANPVGRLLLHLYGAREKRYLAYSDSICSSLKLISLLQNIAIDYKIGRIYLPLDEMEKYKITESHIAGSDNGGMWETFMLSQIERARQILHAGAPLGTILPGRVGLEVRITIMGGKSILRKLHKKRGNVFKQRPVLKPSDWAYMLLRSI